MGAPVGVVHCCTALLPKLVQGIADCVLSTTDGVDAYMDMRVVCSGRRFAISKPSSLATVADLRFRPCHWVMVDIKSDNRDDDTRLFFHVPIGRFRRLLLKALCGHILVSAIDGLLVLEDTEPPHLARVLNPFTGDMLHFAAPLPEHCQHTAVKGGSHSTLVLLKGWGHVLHAFPTSHVFTEVDNCPYLDIMVNFQGNIYCADLGGHVFKFIAPAELVVIAQVSPDVDVYTEGDANTSRSYLVESVGELLLVCYVNRSFKVFRVNVEHKLLEEVKTLSGRTLFPGEEIYVSVDAGKVLSVDGDCIYAVHVRF